LDSTPTISNALPLLPWLREKRAGVMRVVPPVASQGHQLPEVNTGDFQKSAPTISNLLPLLPFLREKRGGVMRGFGMRGLTL